MGQTEYPEWVDPQLSEELPVLRAAGESQELEFKASFPSTARDLAKEIAAFASTNPGMILLGVADDGELLGISELESSKGRDALVRRIAGLCSGTVAPAMTPQVDFAVEENKVVLVLQIPRGDQPIYYCQCMPYVRHLTASRPAKPHEVVGRVQEWLATRQRSDSESGVGDEEIEFLSDVAMILRDSIMWAEEVEDRRVNPGLASLKSTFSYVADVARRLAASQPATERKLSTQLGRLADAADAAVHHRHTLGRDSWEEFVQKVEGTRELAARLKQEILDPVDRTPRFRENAVRALGRLTRELQHLGGRAEEWAKGGRLRELQAEASAIGGRMTMLAYWGLDREDESLVRELKELGHGLHLSEMISFTMGGDEAQALIEKVHRGAEIASGIMAELEDHQGRG